MYISTSSVVLNLNVGFIPFLSKTLSIVLSTSKLGLSSESIKSPILWFVSLNINLLFPAEASATICCLDLAVLTGDVSIA